MLLHRNLQIGQHPQQQAQPSRIVALRPSVKVSDCVTRLDRQTVPPDTNTVNIELNEHPRTPENPPTAPDGP